MSGAPGTVFVVDDDASVRKALSRLLRSAGYVAEMCGSAGEFLARGADRGPCCLVLDVQLPGVTGPELQQQLKAAGDGIPVIFLTGHGDVPMAARAMKVGAVDVLTKPVNDADLLQAVRLALAQDQAARADREALDTLRRRAGTLTPREREVFALVIAGLLNKQIAGELGTSQRTVKVHRGRVMRKMQAHSVAELVRFADRLGIPPVLPTSCARPAPAIRQVTPLPAAPAEGVPA